MMVRISKFSFSLLLVLQVHCFAQDRNDPNTKNQLQNYTAAAEANAQNCEKIKSEKEKLSKELTAARASEREATSSYNRGGVTRIQVEFARERTNNISAARDAMEAQYGSNSCKQFEKSLSQEFTAFFKDLLSLK